MSASNDNISRLLRGTTKVVSVDELKAKLAKGRPLRIKLGVDPTSPDIHLGHTVVLGKLRLFQELGHTVVLILGDFTAAVGDPSGRDMTRPPLSPQEIQANIKTYEDQIFYVLDSSKTEVHRNSEWLDKIFDKNNPDFIMSTLLRRHTVQQLMERDDFTERRKAGQPITVLELLYPLFQGYDSVAVKADVELGGNDQLFNLLMGREMQKDAGQEGQVIMTLPLLEGLDGVRKMSKSYGNHVGLKDPAKEMFAKLMSIPDAIMWNYLELLTEENLAEMKALHPKAAKQKLAGIITARFHGPEAAQGAAAAFDQVFSKGGIPDDLEDFSVPDGGLDAIDLIMGAGLAPSKNEARRLLEQGGVQIGDRKISLGEKVKVSEPVVMKVGKRRFKKLIPIQKPIQRPR